MSDDASARLALPWLQVGQAQKEMTHNEALARLDLAVQASAKSFGTDTPPADPVPGDCWIVGEAPSGAWTGMAGMLAGWSADGWRFVAPTDGMTVWITDQALPARFTADGWSVGDLYAHRVLIGGIAVLGAQGTPIADPAGGAVLDTEARAGIVQILGALREHGLIAS